MTDIETLRAALAAGPTPGQTLADALESPLGLPGHTDAGLHSIVACFLRSLSAPHVADALREVSKWLNEEPNRPIDREAVAILYAALSATL